MTEIDVSFSIFEWKCVIQETTQYFVFRSSLIWLQWWVEFLTSNGRRPMLHRLDAR